MKALHLLTSNTLISLANFIQTVDMSASVPPEKRFTTAVSAHGAEATLGIGGKVCAKFMGSIGGLWPTPQVRMQ